MKAKIMSIGGNKKMLKIIRKMEKNLVERKKSRWSFAKGRPNNNRRLDGQTDGRRRRKRRGRRMRRRWRRRKIVADGTRGRTEVWKVLQEVLADLKRDFRQDIWTMGSCVICGILIRNVYTLQRFKYDMTSKNCCHYHAMRCV